jgi:hypothetical protein
LAKRSLLVIRGPKKTHPADGSQIDQCDRADSGEI